jgi:lysozyme family protein
MIGPWKKIWKRLKKFIQGKKEEKRIYDYKKKTLKSEIYSELDERIPPYLVRGTHYSEASKLDSL